MSEERVIARNKKAEYNYFIEDRYEAGIVLQGTEVKSIRNHQVNLVDSYARIKNEEIFLENMHISPYSHAGAENHQPKRPRKLLLHKSEIRRLSGKIKQKGYTLVPLKVYFLKNIVKVELGLARGKKLYDKRRVIAEKTAKREIERAFKEKFKNR
jgi:SsrA-binding protein